MVDVVQERQDEQDPRDPVDGDPGELDPDYRKKAVIRSANMVADIDQWNPRAPGR